MSVSIDFESANFITGLVLGVLVGWVTLWSFLNPTVGRTLARIAALAVLGFGVIWLVAPLGDLATGSSDKRYNSPLGSGGFGMALGWGVGGVVIGIVALVMTFLHGKRAVPPRDEPPPRAEARAAPEQPGEK